MKRILSVLLAALAALAAEGFAGDDSYAQMERFLAARESRAQALAGATVVTGDKPMMGVVPAEGVRFVVGGSKDSKFEIVWDSGKVTKLPISVREANYNKYIGADPERKKAGRFVISNATVVVGPLWQAVRPNLRQFQWAHWDAYWGRGGAFPHYYDMYLDICESLPKASDHICDLRFVSAADGVRVYFDGSYRRTLCPDKGDTASKRVKEVRYSFAKGASFALKAKETTAYDHGRFTVLDFAANPRAKAFAGAKMKGGGDHGVTVLPGGVPISVCKPIDSGDIAICHEAAGASGLSWNTYLSRDPGDGFCGVVHYRVLAKPYVKAHVVFALDEVRDPKDKKSKGKDPILTLRLMRMIANGPGSNSICQRTLDYTAGVPSDLRKVGVVTRDGKEYPLYLATVDFDLTNLRDLYARRGLERREDGSVPGDYLDLDLAGKIENGSVSAKSDSAFNIFGVTLESAPLSVDFRSEPGSPGNIFTADEKDRRMTLVLRGERDGAKGEIAWTAKEVLSGRVLKSGTLAYGPLAEDETVEKPFDLGFMKEPGVCETTFDVRDGEGAPVFVLTSRMAVVVPSGRFAATEESPYETWWFKGPHGTPSTWDIGGPILQKAGIRKTNVRDWSAGVSEKYGVTYTGYVNAPGQNEFDAAAGKFKPHGNLSGEEWFVTNVTQQIAAVPWVDHMLVWHETAPKGDFPEELLGRPVPAVTDEDRVAAAYVNEIGRIVRKHFPKLRLQIGNSSSSHGAVTKPLRAGVDPRYYDSVGLESGMACKVPELMRVSGVQNLAILKDCAERLAKRPVPVMACFEFVGQADSWIGELRQAQWYVRDALICLAYGMPLVPIGGLCDSNGVYYDTVWGRVGLLRRAPDLGPKPAYVAYAALTKALDGVKLVRRLDTGSATVYALLFRRADGRYATALWCARGEAELEFDVSGGGEVMDMFGRTSRLGTFGLWGKRATGGESPAYVITDKPVEGVKVVRRTFPAAEAFAQGAREVRWFDGVTSISNAPDPRAESKAFRQLPFLKPSDDFTVREAVDPEKGKCLEVTLDTSRRPGSRYFSEYTTLHLAEPAVIEGPCEKLGLWVRGNSDWGSVRLEIEDKSGERFVGFYTHEVNWKGMEWGASQTVDFDGWSVLNYGLSREAGSFTWEYGGVAKGGRSNGRVDFPIRLKSVTVVMNREALDLTEFRPTVPTIRLGPLLAK